MPRAITLIVLLFALLLVPRLALAQEAAPAEPVKATAPALAEVDALKLENLMLKAQQAAIALDKLRADLQGLITSLQKPGYQLTQGSDGKVTYSPVPQTTDAAPEAPPAAPGAK